MHYGVLHTAGQLTRSTARFVQNGRLQALNTSFTKLCSPPIAALLQCGPCRALVPAALPPPRLCPHGAPRPGRPEPACARQGAAPASQRPRCRPPPAAGDLPVTPACISSQVFPLSMELIACHHLHQPARSAWRGWQRGSAARGKPLPSEVLGREEGQPVSPMHSIQVIIEQLFFFLFVLGSLPQPPAPARGVLRQFPLGSSLFTARSLVGLCPYL